jgi:two-component system nitrogen regulation response regulator GlnG
MSSPNDETVEPSGAQGEPPSEPASDTWKREQEARSAAPAIVWVLTILYHSEPHRIGDWAILSDLTAGRELLLSRTSPQFTGSLRDGTAPLADQNLSRRPLRLAALPEGGVRVEQGECGSRVSVRGELLRDAIVLSAADVARGVTLELGGRVVLMLHRVVEAHFTSRLVPVAGDPISAELVGESPAMRQLRNHIHHVADLDGHVLIRGETGSGKELVARAIHRASKRCAGPFVPINLGALPAMLASSELFGTERGAYTDAERRPGWFRQAQGGTLVLDEIGEAPPEIQVALLRVLETGEIQTVGGLRQKVDVRIVASTDADLEVSAAAGTFRPPLLHRLCSCQIHVPPLRERRDDIGRLLVRFLAEELDAIGEGHRLEEPARTGELWLPASIVARLVDHDWPGNVRELRNVVRQIVFSNRGRNRVKLDTTLERMLFKAAPVRKEPATRPISPPPVVTPPVVRRKPAGVSDEELSAALKEAHWDRTTAAQLLGITRPSLYNLMKQRGCFHTARDLTPQQITLAAKECAGDLQLMAERLEISERALKQRLRDFRLEGCLDPDRFVQDTVAHRKASGSAASPRAAENVPPGKSEEEPESDRENGESRQPAVVLNAWLDDSAAPRLEPELRRRLFLTVSVPPKESVLFSPGETLAPRAIVDPNAVFGFHFRSRDCRIKPVRPSYVAASGEPAVFEVCLTAMPLDGQVHILVVVLLDEIFLHMEEIVLAAVDRPKDRQARE